MENFEVLFSDEIQSKFPSACVGIFVIGINQFNISKEKLSSHTLLIKEQLKSKFKDHSVLKNDSVIQAYTNYYKLFEKTYHVLPQIESLIFKGKPLNLPIPLLQIIFLLEMKNRLLTAVHDMAKIEPPIKVGLSSGQETYTLINGSQKTVKLDDMLTSDRAGVISSIIYGPDSRTKISLKTTEAMIFVYAPSGFNHELIEDHFNDIFLLSKEIYLNPEICYRRIFP